MAMMRSNWRCPHCDAEWWFIESIDALMYCFRCWRTWLPRKERTTAPTGE